MQQLEDTKLVYNDTYDAVCMIQFRKITENCHISIALICSGCKRQQTSHRPSIIWQLHSHRNDSFMNKEHTSSSYSNWHMLWNVITLARSCMWFCIRRWIKWQTFHQNGMFKWISETNYTIKVLLKWRRLYLGTFWQARLYLHTQRLYKFIVQTSLVHNVETAMRVLPKFTTFVYEFISLNFIQSFVQRRKEGSNYKDWITIITKTE